jgi:methylthioribose-1-phosphate isomerase
VAANGDVCNKIGTYLKAVAARDNGVPFYVAAPTPSIDPDTPSGELVPIEERDPDEVAAIDGLDGEQVRRVRLIPAASKACNYAFDVTPARLVTGLVTEHGVVEASARGIAGLGLTGAKESVASTG